VLAVEPVRRGLKPPPTAPNWRCLKIQLDRGIAICLLVFAFHSHPNYPLIVAANRDEFYSRPTNSAAYWTDHPQVFAGRDLEKGGTWLGVTTDCRFAALTNFRDPSSRKTNPKSRGNLVSRFLMSKVEAAEFLAEVKHEADDYDDFNIVVGNSHDLYYFSSRNSHVKRLSPGIYGVSNYFLDTPWPKLMQAKTQFQQIINTAEPPLSNLFELLSDKSPAPDDQLPDTGIGLEWERRLSSVFVASPTYGTRASTILLFYRKGGIDFYERNFGENGKFVAEVKENIA